MISSCNSRTGAGFRILLRSRGWGLRQRPQTFFSPIPGGKNKKEGRKGFVTRDRYNVTNGALCFTTQTMEERTARESAVSEEGQVEIRVCRAWRRTVSLLTPVRMEAENYA